ncbi:hypothetical protein [Thioclava kandeliae]|uniref:Uncharacterized protein n=1 Tax=Thioclava kandeliae TaxID=3070818 RepID=A0ABV1SM44_9RHOB
MIINASKKWVDRDTFNAIDPKLQIELPEMDDLNNFLKWSNEGEFYNLLKMSSGLISEKYYWRLCILFSYKPQMLAVFEDYLTQSKPIYTGNPLTSSRGSLITSKIHVHGGAPKELDARVRLLRALTKNSPAYTDDNLLLFVESQMWREVEILSILGFSINFEDLEDNINRLSMRYIKDFHVVKYKSIVQKVQSDNSSSALYNALLKYKVTK